MSRKLFWTVLVVALLIGSAAPALAADPTDAAGTITAAASVLTEVPALALLGVFLVIVFGAKRIMFVIRGGTR